jgi:hypothetical protein
LVEHERVIQANQLRRGRAVGAHRSWFSRRMRVKVGRNLVSVGG